MDWYKEWGNSDSNPKIMKAGFWGAIVFRAFCRASREMSLEGEIPYSYDAEWLSMRLMMFKEHSPSGNPCNEMQRGIVACVNSGLLVEGENGWIIHGWMDRQSDKQRKEPMTSTERSQKYRENLRMQRNATKDATATHGNDRGEERRVEERIEEEAKSKRSCGKPEKAPASAPSGCEQLSLLEEPTKAEEPPPQKAPLDGPDRLMALWNDLAHPSLPRCTKMQGKRRKAAKERLSEINLEEWRTVIKKIENNPFYLGEKGWRANIDWILKDGKATQILESTFSVAPKSTEPKKSRLIMPGEDPYADQRNIEPVV
jgi:hypothetical protein